MLLRKWRLLSDTVSKEVFIDGGLHNTRCTKVVHEQDAATSFFSTFPHESRHRKH